MGRILIGSVLGGLLQFLIGAIAWISPLGMLAYKQLAAVPTADLQLAMARNLPATGTYFIPSPETREGAAMTAHGPVGLVFYNQSGFAPMDMGSILTGLVMSIVTMALVGVALTLVDGFANRLKVAGLFAVALAVYFVLSLPVYNFYLPWAWWVFLGAEELIAFAAGVYVLVRWFMPRGAAQGTIQ